MRRVGKLRYVFTEGLFGGAIMAAAMVAVAWIKTGTIGITAEAIVALVFGGLFGAASARREWNKFASVYPDIGTERDSSEQ